MDRFQKFTAAKSSADRMVRRRLSLSEGFLRARRNAFSHQ